MPFIRISIHIRPSMWLRKGDQKADVIEEFVVADDSDGDWEAFEKAQNAITKAQNKWKQITQKTNEQS